MSNSETTREPKPKVYHLIILDRSGSMSSKREPTIEGLNAQIASMKKASKDQDQVDQVVCVVEFGVGVNGEKVWMKTTEDVSEFTSETYNPSDGGTALYDGMGVGINNLYQEIKDELEKEKATVICTIFTDGQENASQRFTGPQVASLVSELEATGRWTFTFCGCEGNVLDIAARLGIRGDHTLSYAATAKGTQQAFTTMAAGRYARTQDVSRSYATGQGGRLENKGGFFQNLDIPADPKKDDSQA